VKTNFKAGFMAADVYAPCLCGSGKKFKFCCYHMHKKGEMIFSSIDCSKFPVHVCKVMRDWQDIGLSPVTVIRKLGNQSYALASYLVDFWCLGVKDCFVKIGIREY
jgi:hypothetical protein